MLSTKACGWPLPAALLSRKRCGLRVRRKTDWRLRLSRRNVRGEQVRGTLEAADSGAVAEQLFNTGITPVDITVATPSAGRGESMDVVATAG